MGPLLSVLRLLRNSLILAATELLLTVVSLILLLKLCYLMLLCAGGYDLLGRTKDQIKSSQQVSDAKSACEALKLDALVLIGG